MKIWKQDFTPAMLNAFGVNAMPGELGIQVTEIGDDYVAATMPVNHKTVQPYRILHGGANVVLAETLGSLASTMCIADLNTHTAVGLEINANHLKSVREGGMVTGVCRPIRVGKSVHVWTIEVRDAKGDLTCISRLTVSVIEKR